MHDEINRAADVVQLTAEEAAAAGVTLGIEPLIQFEVHLVTTQAQAAASVDRVDHDAIGVHSIRFTPTLRNATRRPPSGLSDGGCGMSPPAPMTAVFPDTISLTERASVRLRQISALRDGSRGGVPVHTA